MKPGVTWVGRPPTTSGSNRLTLYNEWNPLLQWSTGMLSYMYDNVLRFMEQAHQMAKQAVQNLSRVDTGLMRHMADSVLHIRGRLRASLVVGVGNYAPFQEFGTQPSSPCHAERPRVLHPQPSRYGGR